MTQTFSIPADLADSDLTMKSITEIKAIRSVAAASQRIIDGPGEKALRMAHARVAWAEQAEDAVKSGTPVPPKPGRGEDEADPEDYLEE